MPLDVSMCLVVLFSDFGINTNKDSVSRNLFQADHELQHLQKPFLALSARRRRTTTVPQLVADHFQASEKEESPLLRCEIVFTVQVCMQEDHCVPLNGRQRRNRLCWASEHVSWTQQQFLCCSQTSPEGRLLIWREQRTRSHQFQHC
ncbi:HTH_Tnp_Tc3_2 domain-containing protein [Trichonephila clavipes]|nr:HTH_Tnp_Tc3_2 domain-containing protein [Trichonephila clavipes]